MTNSRRFNTLVEVQRIKPNAEVDRTGKIDQTSNLNWEVQLARMGDVDALTGRELLYGGQTASNLSHRVTLRYDPETNNITPKNRLWIEGEAYGIVNVIRTNMKGGDLKQRIIEITAVKKTS